MASQIQENTSSHRKKTKILIFFLFVIFLLGVFFLGLEKGKEIQKKKVTQDISLTESFVANKLGQDSTLDFSLFWKVWDLLKEKHIDREGFEANSLMYGAIKGMLQATSDSHTNFFTPEETQSFTEELNGTFEGIGSEIGMKDDLLTIIAPLPNTPSERAGLRAGDKIIKIDGQTANDFSVDEAVKMIRGEKGTQVVLTIFREGEEQTQDIAITRDVIHLQSVVYEFKEDDVGYVKISTFSDDTTKEFRKFISESLDKNSPGIILDLRNNPGGLVDKCIEIANFFMEKGKTVVIEENYQGKKTALKTTGGNRLSHIPLVVLINEGSASASEILAGALRDNRGIILVGKKSFGKGSVQEYISLPQGTSTKITIAKWLTPNGTYIMDSGIEPDEEVSFTEEDIVNQNDAQLNKALEILRSEIEN